MARSPYLDWLARSFAARPVKARSVLAPDADLVLGYATGYGVTEVAAFVRSLRAVFTGPVILVVDPRPELVAFLAAHDVEVVVAETAAAWAPHPVVERFSAYAAILSQRAWIRNVVLTDVRDVIFQADPFGVPIEGLEFFEENEGQPLSRHAFNVKHLRALAGEALAQTILDRACVCVGVVAGPRDDAIRFCRALLMLCAIPRSQVGGAFGADQAACNMIAHLGLLGGEVCPNYGRVATIGLTASDRLRLDGGRILNPGGGVSAIVHQYDRIDFLQTFVNGRWGEGVAGRSIGPGRLQRKAARLGGSMRRRMPELR